MWRRERSVCVSACNFGFVWVNGHLDLGQWVFIFWDEFFLGFNSAHYGKVSKNKKIRQDQ